MPAERVPLAIGYRVYGLAAVFLGVVELVFGQFAAGWLPDTARAPASHGLVYGAAGVLILGGFLTNVRRTVGVGSLALAVLYAGLMLVFHVPPALAKPTDWLVWQAIAESAAMSLGGVLAWSQIAGIDRSRAAAAARIARLGFGACLLVFGVSHFIYAKFTASLVPSWLPPSKLFWTYATGVAQFAAGLAMLSGIRARLAASLLAAMYAAFSLLVHVPAIVAKSTDHESWAENAINLVLTGAAWCLAESTNKFGSPLRR